MSWFACPLQQHPGGPAQLCPGSSRGSPAYLQQSPLPLLFHWPSWGHCWSCSWRFLLVFCIASLCSLREMAKTAFYCFSTFGKNKYQRERQIERWRPQEPACYQCSLQFWKARRQRSCHPVTSNTLNRLAELWDHPNNSPSSGLTAFPGSAQPVTSQWGGPPLETPFQ